MNLPNAITLFRIFLIPIFVWQFLNGNLDTAAVIFFIAWVSDVLDGWIARKYNLITDFGKIFDPLADKLITLAALFLLAHADIISMILPIIVLAKELTLGIGGALMYKKINTVVGAKWVGKIATFLFTVAIILSMFDWSRAFANILIWFALGAAFIALTVYIISFFKLVKNKQN